MNQPSGPATRRKLLPSKYPLVPKTTAQVIPAQGVEHKEPPGWNTIDAGEYGGNHSKHRDKARQEDDFSSVTKKLVLA